MIFMKSQFQLEVGKRVKTRQTLKYNYLDQEQQHQTVNDQLQNLYLQQYEKHLQRQQLHHHQIRQEPFEDITIEQKTEENPQAQALRKQNEELRLQLQQSRKEVQNLKFQLKCIQTKAEDMRKLLIFAQQQKELRQKFIIEELKIVSDKNRLIDQEICTLYTLFQSTIAKKVPQIQSFSSSFTHVPNQQKQLKKLRLFMSSIGEMHEKISGGRTQNLHKLWKWLKQMGHSYSIFNKWKIKARKILKSRCFDSHLLKGLLEEAAYDE